MQWRHPICPITGFQKQETVIGQQQIPRRDEKAEQHSFRYTNLVPARLRQYEASKAEISSGLTLSEATGEAIDSNWEIKNGLPQEIG